MIEGRSRRRYALVAVVAVALILVAGTTAWIGTHRPTPATAAPSHAVARWSPGAAEATAPHAPDAPPAGGDPAPIDGNATPFTTLSRPPTAGDDQPPAGTAEPPLPPSPVPPTAALTVRFHPSTRWDGGMVGYFAISNTTTAPVNGWRLVVTVAASVTVTASWEATMHREGNRITFTSTSTSARVDVGATVRFGLQASSGPGFYGPDTCLINGATCA
jgi:hypothetical protein